MTPAALGKTRSRFAREDGQIMVVVLLALGIFLLGAVAFAVDIANLWFHRQNAQNAADAACTASAMDMLFNAQDISVSSPLSSTSWGALPKPPVTGTTYNCAGGANTTPCRYAALNGYNGAGIAAGTDSNSVEYSFLPTVTEVASCSATPMPDVCVPAFLAFPGIRVNVREAVRVYFAGLISGARTMDVATQATCGVVAARSPAPIVVLNPVGNSLALSGSPSIRIYGGPSASIQVNSSASNAASGGGEIDLRLGGPNLTGSTIGVFGGPNTACCSFKPGTTGAWVNPSSPISDPYAQVPTPAQPANAPAPVVVAKGVDGCPIDAGETCYRFAAGYYPSGIDVKKDIALFEPGLYYLAGDLSLESNSTVRPSTATGDGSGGTTFYFKGSAKVTVHANSGKDMYDIETGSGAGSLQYGVRCSASGTVPANMPSTLSVGNVLVAPCTGPYGDPLLAQGLSNSNPQRGILFFQDRSSKNITAAWGGGGKFALVGSIYMHSCNAAGTGTGCGPSGVGNFYTNRLSFSGNSGSGSYVVGNIIADNISMSGTPDITMNLNPEASYWILKATLLN